MRWRGALLGALGLLALPVAATAAVHAYPEPLYPYRITEGRITLRADRPFDTEAARPVLREVQRRVAASGLDDGRPHRIFVAGTPWRARLGFLWAYGAGGVSFWPWTRHVVLRGADIARDELLAPGGDPVPAPRGFAYYAAHEIGHVLTGEAVGIVAYFRLPVWMREGVADVIGFGVCEDPDEMARRLRAGAPEMDPARSGLYARHRLMVLHATRTRGLDLPALLRAGLDGDTLLRELREAP